VSEACPVLRAWDLHDNLDSNGAILFRRFVTRLLSLGQGVTTTPGIYVNQFDANDPVHTPNGLNVANPAVEQSFADAVSDLRNAGIPLDAPLRGWQYERRGNERIPIHGGPGGVSIFNAINVGWVGSGSNPGYPNVPHGSSFVMASQFTDDPDCPVDTRTILTYSQSTNPSSPYFADQTRMFSNKQWVDEPYCEGEIQTDPNFTTEYVTEGAEGYPRPAGATKLRVPLAIAYQRCESAAANRVHGGGLAAPSCNPADRVSDHLTVGTRDANGVDPAAIGAVHYTAVPGDPDTTEDEADVALELIMTDVRNSGDLSDYEGELQADTEIRITDKLNGPLLNEPATVTEVPFSFVADCAATAEPAGGRCSVKTSADALLSGTVTEGKRAVWQVGDVRVYDGGADGQAATGDNTLFARQGIFVP
jgi:hypothetical protein